MKVKTWIQKGFSVAYLEDETAKKLLWANGFSYLVEYREEILDIPEEDIVDDAGYPHHGFWYANVLHGLVHDKSRFYDELDNLEYEIIEEGYPDGIPYCDIDIYTAKDFRNWMLEQGTEEQAEVDKVVDVLNSIGCTSFQLTADELNKIVEEKYNV